MVKTVHVVPHSHWDREWYFTTSRSKIYLLEDLNNVMSLLENKDGYDYFILDGQASLLDDYLKWRPQDKNRIKKLVQAGKLIIGPWYTQTDQLVISAESIVRNMLYGTRICKEFGPYMNVGYVPDSFGQAANMPQIYRSFGMNNTLFWRGVSDDQVQHTEYIWEGTDGSTVNVYQIPSGYYIGGAIPEDEEDLKKFLHAEPFKTTWSRSTTNQVYFPNGFDQAPPRANLPELVEKMNQLYTGEYHLQLSTIEKYIESVENENPKLEKISGELFNGKLMRIHKSIFSSRSDLKQMNTQLQHYLTNVMEPLLVLGDRLGIAYPVEVVRDIWKMMFENAAHDSIGSCVSDTTNEDVYMRYKQVRDISSNLVEITLRKIAMRIQDDKKKEITLTIFNPSDTDRTEVIIEDLYLPQKEFAIYDVNGQQIPYTILSMEDQTDYILNQGNILNPSKKIFVPTKVYLAKVAIATKDIPALGYQQLIVDLSGNTHSDLKESNSKFIENNHYQIAIEENGSLTVTDKSNGIIYKNQAVLEENGDDGDSFNYSPPREDMLIHSTDFKPTIKVVQSEIIQQAIIHYDMFVPQNLEQRKVGIAQTLLPVTMTISLFKNSPVIDFSVEVDNRMVDSHRLCVLFDSGIASKFSIADQQFGLIKRPVYREEEMKLWKENKEQWNEKPISIEPCQNFVSLVDNEHGVVVLPKGVREYEIVGDDYSIIRLTLFRSYGYMGKENLLYRPGRASGEKVIQTPNAQLHKVMTFAFSAFYLHDSFNHSQVGQKAKLIHTPLQCYQLADYLNTRLRFTLPDVHQDLSNEYQLLNDSSNSLVLSVIKKAEERPGYVFRWYNALDQKDINHVDISFAQKIRYAELIDLKEDKINNLEIVDNGVVLSNIGPDKFVTLYVEFE